LKNWVPGLRWHRFALYRARGDNLFL